MRMMLLSATLALLLMACEEKANYADFGGETEWAQEDYAQLAFNPTDFASSVFYPGLAQTIADSSEVGYMLWFDDHQNDYFLENQILVRLPELPKLRCYPLRKFSHRLIQDLTENLLTATHYTETGGGGGEQYIIWSHPTVRSEVCFTGITEDRKLFQGYFSMAFVHDTLGPRIPRERRPEYFTIPMAEFQVTLRE